MCEKFALREENNFHFFMRYSCVFTPKQRGFRRNSKSAKVTLWRIIGKSSLRHLSCLWQKTAWLAYIIIYITTWPLRIKSKQTRRFAGCKAMVMQKTAKYNLLYLKETNKVLGNYFNVYSDCKWPSIQYILLFHANHTFKWFVPTAQLLILQTTSSSITDFMTSFRSFLYLLLAPFRLLR